MRHVDLPSSIYDLAHHIGELPDVERVLLFGSRARGNHSERSDIDIAVEANDNPIARSAAFDLVENAPTLLPIDLVWLPEASPAFRDEVRREGIVLFERSLR